MLANGLEARYFLSVDVDAVGRERPGGQGGDVLARIAREAGKSRDITGGLPRVAELFEARKPKDYAIIGDDRGRGRVRQGLQEQAPYLIVRPRRGRQPHRVPDPQGQAHQPCRKATTSSAANP